MELFLGLQDDWAEDSPHYLVILYEMFQHAAIEGQKEAEQIVCQGCHQNMPQLGMLGTLPLEKKSEWKNHIGALVNDYTCTQNSATWVQPLNTLYMGGNPTSLSLSP